MKSAYDSLPVFAQNLACTWAGYQRSRARFTPHFHRTLGELERTASAPIEALHELQWRRLSALVEHARREVPFYAGLAAPARAATPLDGIRATLSAIEPLAKQTYRDRHDEFLARDLDPRALIRGKTSGTTGTALPLWYTPEALAEEFATFWRMRRAAGADRSDPNLTFNGQTIVPVVQQRPPFWRTNYWSGQKLFSLYHCTRENLRAYVDEIHRTRAVYAQGYPSAMHLVARAMLDEGRPLPPDRLRACFTSSESLLAFQRAEIERAFGARVFDRYGVSEFCVSMTECRRGNLHVDMEFGIVEVDVVEESDDWVRGPLLVTGLANEATPLLRYRVGDVGTRSKRPARAGAPATVFLEIDGRIEDYVQTPGRPLVGRLDHVFKEQLDVAEAQVLQETPAALEVLVVRRPEYDAASEQSLLKEFRSRLGEEIAIELRYVDAIPREPNGKFRAVKSAVGGCDDPGRPRAHLAHLRRASSPRSARASRSPSSSRCSVRMRRSTPRTTSTSRCAGRCAHSVSTPSTSGRRTGTRSARSCRVARGSCSSRTSSGTGTRCPARRSTR
jgi:phenylacetate-CoA ligase